MRNLHIIVPERAALPDDLKLLVANWHLDPDDTDDDGNINLSRRWGTFRWDGHILWYRDSVYETWREVDNETNDIYGMRALMEERDLDISWFTHDMVE